MPDPLAPIRIRCEGSGCHAAGAGLTFERSYDPICAMCGHAVRFVDGLAVEHDRDDTLAMLARGDFEVQHWLGGEPVDDLES